MANEYVVSKSRDRCGKEYFYCHKRGFEYIPVFSLIGSKEKARDICKLMNGGKK